MGNRTDGDDWWMYVGNEWVSLDAVGITGVERFEFAAVGSTAVGSTTMFYADNPDLFGIRRELWIVATDQG